MAALVTDRLLQGRFYSGVKVPLLLLVSFALSFAKLLRF